MSEPPNKNRPDIPEGLEYKRGWWHNSDAIGKARPTGRLSLWSWWRWRAGCRCNKWLGCTGSGLQEASVWNSHNVPGGKEGGGAFNEPEHWLLFQVSQLNSQKAKRRGWEAGLVNCDYKAARKKKTGSGTGGLSTLELKCASQVSVWAEIYWNRTFLRTAFCLCISP